jgi:hypothetical protein
LYVEGGLPALDPESWEDYPGSGFFGEFDTSHDEVLKGQLSQFESLGFRQPTAEESYLPGWGLGPDSTDLDQRDQYSQPYASGERIQRFDVQRCVLVPASEISPLGVAYELVHWRSPSSSIVVLEQIPTMFDQIVALDDAGVEYYDFGSLNGERPCRNQLVHPNPLVTTPLTWRFFLTFTDDPSREVPSVAPDLTYRGPIPPAELSGQAITPPWSDARYGSQNRWAENQQFFAPSSVVVRYWVILAGPVDRFRVRVGARLGGFFQSGGKRGSALDAVQTRRI